MMRLQKVTACFLLAVLPLTAVGGAFVSCQKPAMLQSQAGAADTDPHAYHGGGHLDAEIPDAAAQSTDCDCCDGCTSICPATSCAHLLLETYTGEFVYDAGHAARIFADRFREIPPPHPLLRPPILLP